MFFLQEYQRMYFFRGLIFNKINPEANDNNENSIKNNEIFTTNGNGCNMPNGVISNIL